MICIHRGPLYESSNNLIKGRGLEHQNFTGLSSIYFISASTHCFIFFLVLSFIKICKCKSMSYYHSILNYRMHSHVQRENE